jgi:hypothetical protein
LINILFIIFYNVDKKGEVNLKYDEAEVAVELLGICQVIIAFMVMISYIVRYHGKIYEEYLDQYKMQQRDRFSNVKGSLGYSFGSEVFKLDHIVSVEQNSNGHEKDTELDLHKKKNYVDIKELRYAINIFFIAIRRDSYHAFNVVYFCLSVLGIFYHAVFSFLLLDIVIKIPLLTNVV